MKSLLQENQNKRQRIDTSRENSDDRARFEPEVNVYDYTGYIPEKDKEYYKGVLHDLFAFVVKRMTQSAFDGLLQKSFSENVTNPHFVTMQSAFEKFLENYKTKLHTYNGGLRGSILRTRNAGPEFEGSIFSPQDSFNLYIREHSLFTKFLSTYSEGDSEDMQILTNTFEIAGDHSDGDPEKYVTVLASLIPQAFAGLLQKQNLLGYFMVVRFFEKKDGCIQLRPLHSIKQTVTTLVSLFRAVEVSYANVLESSSGVASAVSFIEEINSTFLTNALLLCTR